MAGRMRDRGVWVADDFADFHPPVGRATRVARVVLIAIGVLGLLYASYLYTTTVGPRKLPGVLLWLGAAVVLHDGILSPLVFGANFVLRRVGRRIPNVVLAIGQVAVIVGVVFTLMVVPELRAQALGTSNPTVLPLHYGLRLALLWAALVALATLASILALRRRRPNAHLPLSVLKRAS